ncbi:MAG: flavodoxin family protein [Eggerthellaceae bacterium]|nr:flavodoxin family protein [Eggerthellaceae bacterium]
MKNRLIILGSFRPRGRCAQIAKALEASYTEADPKVSVTVFSLAQEQVGPCRACNSCACDDLCTVDDDMQKLYTLLEGADEVTAISPVFFAGPSAQFKALLDRLQFFFWQYSEEREAGKAEASASKASAKGLSAEGRLWPKKRPLRLFVVGDGNDPHGIEPLVICVRSAFAIAGFRLEDVFYGIGLDEESLDDMVAHPEPYRYRV